MQPDYLPTPGLKKEEKGRECFHQVVRMQATRRLDRHLAYMVFPFLGKRGLGRLLFLCLFGFFSSTARPLVGWVLFIL